ncbi:long-chain fatty acid--CoA ligase [Planctomycetota bacterium]
MNVNIGCWVSRNARLYRRKVALACAEKRLTYPELDRRVNQLGAALLRRGVARGDRVALLLHNSIELVESVFACAKIGAIAVPLNWRLSEAEHAYVVGDCTPRVLMADEEMQERALALAGSCSAVQEVAGVGGADGAYERWVDEEEPAEVLDPSVGGSDPHLIMYTSGSTGDPKGVMLSHANTFWQTINGWALGVAPDTVCLVLLPLVHVGGLNGSVTPMIHVGATVLVQRCFDAREALLTMERERVTGVVGVPQIFQFFSELPEFATVDLSACSVLISGGAPLSESLMRVYHDRGLEFRQGYGLTEASPGVSGMGPGECVQKLGSVGKPCLYTDVEVCDARGRAVEPGATGEIRVRGPNVMLGYWNRPDDTKEAIRGGWLYTGDLGHLDEDGFLYVSGRLKEMIISGGENIFPAEIEKVLQGHPAVGSVAVMGRPDGKWGEVPIAVVQPAGERCPAEDLIALCEQQLARYKVPRGIVFIDELPLTSTGKVARAVLRDRLLGDGH